MAEAATVAEDVADLLDRAFDWDCIIVAEARKEVSNCDLEGVVKSKYGDEMVSQTVTVYE